MLHSAAARLFSLMVTAPSTCEVWAGPMLARRAERAAAQARRKQVGPGLQPYEVPYDVPHNSKRLHFPSLCSTCTYALLKQVALLAKGKIHEQKVNCKCCLFLDTRLCIAFLKPSLSSPSSGLTQSYGSVLSEWPL